MLVFLQKVATKFRKGACTNCGAITHKKIDCLEKPRKIGAKWTGRDFAPDEHIPVSAIFILSHILFKYLVFSVRYFHSFLVQTVSDLIQIKLIKTSNCPISVRELLLICWKM